MIGPLGLLYRFIDYMNGETDERIEKYIDETYYYYMRISGIYPLLSRKYALLTFVQLTVYMGVLIFHIYLLGINSIYFFDKSFVLFSQEVHFLLICIVGFFIITTNAAHRRDFSRIHRYMAADYFDYNEGRSKVMDGLKLEVRNAKLKLMMVPLAASINGGFVMFVSRLLDNRFGDFDAEEYDINFMLPFPIKNSDMIDTSQGFGFLLAAGGQLLCVTVMLPLAITGAGFVLVSVLLDFSRQLKFLLHKIEAAEERAAALYYSTYGTRPTEKGAELFQNEKFLKCYQICVNRCVDHHAVLLSVFDNIVGFMGLNFFQCFLVGSIMIALSANCVASPSNLPGTTVANLALCLNEIAYMYLLSAFGQDITDLSEEIRYKFYGLKWYYCDIGFKKGLAIMQEGSLKSMTIMGAKILPVDLNTFSNVMNSSYTYYNLLNAFTEET